MNVPMLTLNGCMVTQFGKRCPTAPEPRRSWGANGHGHGRNVSVKSGFRSGLRYFKIPLMLISILWLEIVVTTDDTDVNIPSHNVPIVKKHLCLSSSSSLWRPVVPGAATLARHSKLLLSNASVGARRHSAWTCLDDVALEGPGADLDQNSSMFIASLSTLYHKKLQRPTQVCRHLTPVR